MTDTLGKIKEFVNYACSLKGYEKGEAQVFCDRLFQTFGHQGCVQAGAKLEYRLKSEGKHTKFPDLVWRPRLLLEMKSRGEKLEEHIQQAREYWDELKPQPRYVVLCNFDEFWIYDTTIQIEEPVNRVKLEELPQRYATLNFLFPGNAGVEPHGRGTAMPCPYENIPPSGAVRLFGREQELERLHQLLTPPAPLIKGGEQRNKLFIAAIVGMGGVGKTELAIQYAWQHLQGLGDGAGGVCWVDARDGNVGIQLVNFARSLLNLNPPEDWDLPTQLKYCWRNWQPGDWLIVIDDVTNYRQQVKSYLPPESSQLKVLLTTREELGRPVEHLPLNKLQPEAALDLLTSLVGVQQIQQESEIAEQLCQWLDYLPLGLELVGRYLERDPDLSLKAMLSLLEKKRLRHRSVLEADPTMTAKLGVADAFELSWERLDENAQCLGCLLSLFASADIPWWLVEVACSHIQFSEDGEINLEFLEEARANLLRCHLLERKGGETYCLHPLIREFLREKREQSGQVNELKRLFSWVVVTVAKRIPDSLTRQQVQVLALAMPHLAEVVKDKDLWKLLSDENFIWPFAGLGRFYESQGLYDQASPWREQCLSYTQSRFGSDHLNVAISLHNLAHLYKSQGRYSEAEPLLLQALKLLRSLLGENHPDVATNLNSLGSLYNFQGRYSKAEPLLLQALQQRQRMLGADHPDVIESLSNLAFLHESQGCYSKAEYLYVQALKLKKRWLGENHPYLATTLDSLALVYRSQGRYSEAESLHMQALALNKYWLGDNHPDIADSLNNLALVYQSQGRFDEAESLYVKALQLYKSLLGENHPHVAIGLHNLADLYLIQNRYSEAEALCMQALNLRKRLLGENHPDVANNLNSLAILYQDQGRYSEAESLHLQALELKKRLLGKNHPDVAQSLNNLAILYYYQCRYREAETLLVQALEIRQQRLGLGHPHTVDSRDSLGIIRNILNSTGET